MAVGRKLNLRLFLEGIEVSVRGATINSTMGRPSTAQIRLIPTMQGMFIKPRTLVHLFFEDVKGVYRLLFTGEVLSIRIQKTSESRDLILECQDHSNYYETAFSFYFDSNDPTVRPFRAEEAHFVGASTGFIHNLAGTTGTFISRVLQSEEPPRSPQFSETRGVLRGIIKLIEMLTGVQGGGAEGQPETAGVNAFFTYSQLRCRILEQLGVPEGDDTSAKLVENTTIWQFLGNEVEQLSTLVSMKTIIDLVLSYMFYRPLPNTAPRYRKTGKKKKTITLLDSAAAEPIEDFENALTTLLSTVDAAVNDSTLLEILRANTQELVNGYKPGELFDPVVSTSAAGLAARELSSSKLENVLTAFENIVTVSKTATRLKKRVQEVNTLLLKIAGEAFLTSPDLQAISLDLNEALAITRTLRNLGTFEVEVPEADSLYTLLFLPNLFYVPPPRCNILFPEQYTSLSYSRNFISETTRLYLSVNQLPKSSGGDTEITMEAYYAPSDAGYLSEVQGLVASTQQIPNNPNKSVADVLGGLMNHERFSGIVPKFAHLEKASFYSDDFLGELSPEIKKLYLKRVANFHFFEKRFGSRALDISGPFNPMPVLGLPMLVVDKQIRSGEIKSVADVKNVDATNYIAVPVTITHTLDQSMGGSTTITCRYAREHRGEDDDFVSNIQKEEGVDLGQLTARNIDWQTAILSNNLDDINFLLSLTEKTGKDSTQEIDVFGGKINSPQFIRTPYIGTRGKSGIIKYIEVLDSTQAGGVDDVELLLAPAMASRVFTQDDLDLLATNPNQEVIVPVYNRVRVHEDPGTREITSSPFEEIVRPLWVSDIYSNSKIGAEVYQPLLGVRAITDGRFDGILNSAFDRNGNKFTTTEDAVDYLLYKYSKQKKLGGSAVYFADQVTQRPIATLDEVLGEGGFHSRSFGNFSALENLNFTRVPRQADILRGCSPAELEKVTIPKKLDTRAERRQCILKYRNSLSSRGLLG